MEVIKSLKDLPEWFRKAKYEKNLDAADWYREIRRRQWAAEAIGTLSTMAEKRGATIKREHAVKMIETFYTPMKKDWVIYSMPQYNLPVEDMSKMEAMYIAACLADENGMWAFESYKELLRVYNRDRLDEKRTLFTREYEEMLGAFFEEFGEETDRNEDLNSLAVDCLSEIGCPYLSYGRPLKGYPVVIDTQFDDDTILAYVKKWLAERRELNGEKARRPFMQNDFDDWAYYKIREVNDLDTWARVHNVRIPDRVIAAALWPNAPDEMSPLDVLRTTSRRKVKEVFRWEVCVRLYSQLSLERGEKFLEQ